MTQVRTVDGRIAGRRGQATRTRLLECLGELIASTSYRDVTVIDVARQAGTSPATFYQYFPDIQAAEGDRRFSRIRMKLLNSVVQALTEAISELQRGGRLDADVHPAATAGALVTMLAASAAHTKAFDSWSVKDGELRSGLTRLVAWGVTGRKPA
jgi:AcrR family transcriptional regulator